MSGENRHQWAIQAGIIEPLSAGSVTFRPGVLTVTADAEWMEKVIHRVAFPVHVRGHDFSKLNLCSVHRYTRASVAS